MVTFNAAPVRIGPAGLQRDMTASSLSMHTGRCGRQHRIGYGDQTL